MCKSTSLCLHSRVTYLIQLRIAYKQTNKQLQCSALGSFFVCEDYSLFKGLSFLEFHPFSEIECGTTPRVEHDWKTKIFKRKIFVFVFLVEG